MKQLKDAVFVAFTAAIMASLDGLVLAAVPSQAEIDAYVLEQAGGDSPLAKDLRDCEIFGTGDEASTNYALASDDGASYERARVRVPKSGWALKKFPGVYAWVHEYENESPGWDTNLVIIERGEPIPVIKKYNV